MFPPEILALGKGEQGMAREKICAVVVSHTHWDREWYSTFEQFRFRLVKLIDKLLHILDSDTRFRVFMLDGQAVVLEDYLEIRPENRARLERYIGEGRILVGPWYVLADEFLVSGEALVRNLLIGHQVAEQFGQPMKAGYVPDAFGHTGQLPQILAGFGIGSAFFGRGMGPEGEELPSEFSWEAPDGTAVLGVHLPHSYCNAASLGYRGIWGGEGQFSLDLALERVRSEVQFLAQRAATNTVLLCNGCDHLEPQPELPEIIEYCNERLEDAELVHGTLLEYIARVNAAQPELKPLRGELHWGRFNLILPNVLSTRIYLKQANARCQTLLEKYAEPVAAIAWLLGEDYPQGLLRYAWKLLLKNHPHDSICGCSVDAVHREMMGRFEKVEQVADTIVAHFGAAVAERLNLRPPEQPQEGDPFARALVVFNPCGWARREVAALKTTVALPAGMPPPQVVVRDAAGEVVPSQVLSQKLSGWRHGVPQDKMAWDVELAFLADVPPLGLAVYYTSTRRDLGLRPKSELVASANAIENSRVRVEAAPDGTLTIIDKQTGAVYRDCNLLEDTEDAGDEYNFSPAQTSRTITSKGAPGRVSLVESGPARAALRIDFTLTLPAGLTEDRCARTEETVDLPVSVHVSLQPGSPRVDIALTIDNRAKDHRLRALFPTGIAADVCFAEQAFDVVERRLDLPPADETWSELPSPEKPQQSFVDVSGEGRGLCLANVGLPEYEVRRDGGQATICLTLLRSVGWLSRGDFIRRRGNAGPQIPTPEAQCLGRHTFRYALIPHAGDWEEAQVWAPAHNLRAPLAVREEPFHEGPITVGRISLVTVEPEGLVLSAVKKAERGDELVVRLYNTTTKPLAGTITCHFPLLSAQLANLEERPLPNGELEVVEGKKVQLDVPAKRIITLLLKPAPAPH